MHWIALGLLVLSFVPAASGQNAAFDCPASITVSETAAAPDGWSAESGSSKHRFQMPKIYNGKPGGEEYELKPDGQKTAGKKTIFLWKLSDYRDLNLFVRCVYHGTPATVTADIPAALKTCTATLELSPKGDVIGRSEMACK
jgi:hypothetical protein